MKRPSLEMAMDVRHGRQNSACLVVPASHCPGSILMIALVTGADGTGRNFHIKMAPIKAPVTSAKPIPENSNRPDNSREGPTPSEG
jgi:hypothetical protein